MNTKKAYELIQNILSGLPERSKQSVLNKLFSNEKSNADKVQNLYGALTYLTKSLISAINFHF